MILPPADRRKRILALAMPIVGGMISQNVLNLVDTAMVGSLGDTALAAVGFGGFVNFLLVAAFNGLGTGVQTMAARRVGEGRRSETALPLNGGLLVGVAVSIPWSIIMIVLLPSIFPHLVSDPSVVALAVPYVQIRLCAHAPFAMNGCFRGHWNATDRSALYMRTLMVTHSVNIVLNWLLIFGHLGFPELGTNGAAIASAIATGVGTLVYFRLGFRHSRPEGFLSGLPGRETLATMLRLAVPSSLQQVFFSASMTAFFWIVGLLGTRELAASNVVLNLFLVGLLPGFAFGIASLSLVGQALGRGDARDARRWAWDVVRTATVVVGAVAIVGAVFPRLLLGFFIHDPDTLELAVWPLRMAALGLGLDASSSVLMQSLIGAGATRTAMVVSASVQWLLVLPCAYFVGPVLGLGLTAVWAAQVGARVVQAVIYAALWRGGRWASIRV